MRAAGRRLATVVESLRQHVREGVCGLELDELAERLILAQHARPSFKGYRSGFRRAFPKAICVSVNDQVVHGIPDDRPFSAGDLVSLDLGLCYDDYHADVAFTESVGACSDGARRLLDATRESLYKGVARAIPGGFLGDVGHAIESHLRTCGFQVVQSYTGHGIGRKLHEDPAVPNQGEPGKGLLIKSGMCLALEPMATTGNGRTRTGRDGWTVYTADGALAAHFEHTVVVTPHGPEVLTALVEQGTSGTFR